MLRNESTILERHQLGNGGAFITKRSHHQLAQSTYVLFCGSSGSTFTQALVGPEKPDHQYHGGYGDDRKGNPHVLRS